MVPIRLYALLTLAVLLAPPAAVLDGVPHEEVVEVAVIVHVGVGDTPNAAEIRRIFLARQRFWGDGRLIRPVNLGATAPARAAFTARVLGGHVQDYTAYWNDLWFHGTAPPPVLGSDEAVLLYVARTPGAIGYVNAEDARAAPAGIRIVLLLRSP